MSIPLQQEIHYPDSDGKPMAETHVHGQVLLDLMYVLDRRFAGVPDVYAWGNMLLYYVEGQPKFCVAPDVFVAKGVVGKHKRRSYKVWVEGKAPSLVIEVTSESTRGEDLDFKKDLYQRLGVEEYFLFDPLGDYLKPRLQGYRMMGGRYQHLPLQEDGALWSQTTGLYLRPEGERLRLIDGDTSKPLPWPFEETQRADRAEDRVRVLEEELKRLRGEPAE